MSALLDVNGRRKPRPVAIETDVVLPRGRIVGIPVVGHHVRRLHARVLLGDEACDRRVDVPVKLCVRLGACIHVQLDVLDVAAFNPHRVGVALGQCDRIEVNAVVARLLPFRVVLVDELRRLRPADLDG